ncbi:hypothetical protein Hanom_Chr09g00778161 [Helianthus anomalus]
MIMCSNTFLRMMIIIKLAWRMILTMKLLNILVMEQMTSQLFKKCLMKILKELLKRKIEEKVKGVSPRMSKEEVLEARKTWFKPTPKERKFRRPLAFFTRNPDVSLGDILSWGWIPELNVFGIKREFRVQYFRHLSDIKNLPNEVYNFLNETGRSETVEAYPISSSS